MKNLILFFLCIPLVCINQNSFNIKDVFSKMDIHDVYILQNEIYSNLSDSIIEIKKIPFKILFKSKKHLKNTNNAIYISFLKDKINTTDFKIGTKITNNCIFHSSNQLAQGPFADYFGISGNSGCHRYEDEQIEFCCNGIGHHFFYYTDEYYRNMNLLESNTDILNLEYEVSNIYDTELKNISMTLLDTIYILTLQDFNFNNILDKNELTISTIKFIN
jgi:hypothetical protein